MTYTHFTTDELVMIKFYHHQNIAATIITKQMNRSRQPIYNVINFLKMGHSALDFYTQYKKTRSTAAAGKSFCRRNK